jgi:site-specific recombinase XerD
LERPSVATPGSVENLDDMATSWVRHLRAENKAPQTVMAYTYATDQLRDYLRAQGLPLDVASIQPSHVEAFLVDVLERRSPATANNRYRGLKAFFGWLEAEGEIPRSPMARMKPPTIPEQPAPVPSLEDLQALLGTCSGPDFVDRRDNAILMLFVDSGIRLTELTDLRLTSDDGPDVELDAGLVRVLGKGGRMRVASFGRKTGKALDRYLRKRSAHPDAHLEWLWLGRRGRMTPSGVRQMVWRRSAEAGIDRLHPHSFRHYFAHSWLASGGAEIDLMELAGWKTRTMLTRYARSTRAERAHQAHQRHGPGDRL